MRFLVLIIAALAPLFTSVAQAQDLPGRVGRLAFIEGQVSLYQDPDAGWERARINYPVTSENSLWTDRGSRAEMRVSGISVRLAETTQLDLVRIDDDQLDAFVTQGAINVRVRHFDANQRLDFSTPQARFRIAGVGRYRIDVDEQSDEATLTVFAGNAVLRSSRGNVQVRAGSALRVYGGSRSSYNFERASLTAFDRWSNTRDERWQETRSSRYVSTYMTGYEDLDAYGEWREEPEFGALWFPARVERDWAPYRYGRWENVRPWGWTWVDDAPWGYAPFHYGRWVHVRDRWAWSPGKREERPAWAPALVSWVGGSASGGGGGPTVGWYPLSPWDRYQPWYNASPTYVNRVNIVVRSEPPRQDRQVWRESARVQGATVVRREQFAESRPMNQAAIRLAPEATRSLQATTPTQALPPPSEVRTRRAQTQAQQAPAAAPPVATAPPAPRVTPPPGQPQGTPPPAPRVQQPEGEKGNRGNDRGNRGNAPDFKRPQAVPEPAPANPEAAKGVPGPKPAAAAPEAPKGTAPPATRPDPQRQQQEKAARDAQQQAEKAAREAQQQQEKAARDAQQQQEKAAKEGQQQRDRQQQEKGARDAQQQQEKAARDAQQQKEKAARDAQQQQEKAARDAQQQQEKAAREGQQQRDRQQQEKAARDAQQQQEKAARDAQQQKEKAAREAQQQQEKAARDAQQQQRQQQEKAARDAQQRAAPPTAAPPAPPPAAAPPAPAQPAATRPPQAQPQGKGKPDKDKDEEKDKEDKEKGKKN